MSALLKLLLIKPFRGRSRLVGSPDVRMGINMRWLSGSFVSVLRRIARVILDIQSVSSSPVPGGCHIRYGSRLEISEGVRDSLFLVLVRYSYDSCVDTAGWQFHFGSINGVSPSSSIFQIQARHVNVAHHASKHRVQSVVWGKISPW